jgi:hypothetical protein
MQQSHEKLKQRGEIESYEVVLLEPHGGDLGGFALIRGTPAKLNRLRYDDEEFLALLSKANLLVSDIGVVGAAIGDRIMKQTAVFQKAIQSLEPMGAGVR